MAELDPKLRARFAKRCKTLRLAAGLSQMAVARHSDFGLSHYQRLERGDVDPKLSTLVRLAEIYGVTLSVLFEGLG
jgi:transcriptional regulator with XRE-family HTH domain